MSAGLPRLMLPREVAALFGVSVHTVTRWAHAGKLTVMYTPTGQRRYLAGEVEALYVAGQRSRVPR